MELTDDKQDGEKYPTPAAVETPMPATVEEMVADFKRTRNRLVAEGKIENELLVKSSIKYDACDMRDAERINRELAAGRWMELLNSLPSDTINKPYPLNNDEEATCLVEQALFTSNEPFAKELLKRGADFNRFNFCERENLNIRANTLLGLSVLNPDISHDFMGTLLEHTNARDCTMIGTDLSNEDPLPLCNFLGYDIKPAKKRVILAWLRRQRRYDMLKHVLIAASRHGVDGRNGVRTLLAEGDFYHGHQFELLLESSKRFMGENQITKDMECYREGLQELGPLFIDLNTLIQLFSCAGTDIFPELLTTTEAGDPADEELQ